MSDIESYHSVIDDDEYSSPLLGSRLSGVNHYHNNGNVSSIPCPSVVILEPPNSYRSRWRSIRIMYLTMFMGSVTFTITVSSLWPFLQELDPSVTPSFLGWVVAAYSLGQLIASPFFGGWANLRKSSREPLTVSLLLTVLFNILYMYLQSIHDKPQIYMIVARGLVGFSAGCVAVVRSYISAATTLKERTACMANVSIFQALGFILGPVIQTCLVPLHFPGPVESPSLHINMYTAPAMFSSILAMVNLLLVMFVFKEHKVDGLEEAGIAGQIQKSDDEEVEEPDIRSRSNGHAQGTNGEDTALLDSDEERKPDIVAVLSTIFLFFAILFMFTVFETIGTPLTMHMYAWTKTEATLYQGIILGCSAATSIAVFVIVKILAKKFNERYLLLAGLIISFGAFLLFIPWGPSMPPLAFAPENNATGHTNSSHLDMFDDPISESLSLSALSQQDANVLNFEPQTRGHRLQPFKNPSQNNMPDGTKSHVFNQEPSRFSPVSEDMFSSLGPSAKRDGLTIHERGLLLKNARSLKDQMGHSYQKFSIGSKPSSENRFNHDKQHVRNDSKLVSKLSLYFKGNDSLLNHTTLSTNATPSSSKPSSSSPHTTARTTLSTQSTTSTHGNGTVSPEGCPWQYTWCREVPALPLLQYLAATLVFSVGYPMCQMLSYTIYSKILGSMPQGVWMGWITAAGSLARTVGPIYVSQVYDMSGPQVTFGSVAGFILLTTIFYLVVFRRLVPCQERRGQENGSATHGTQ